MDDDSKYLNITGRNQPRSSLSRIREGPQRSGPTSLPSEVVLQRQNAGSWELVHTGQSVKRGFKGVVTAL